jgi:YVTN family beta-propeller protein
VLVVLGAVIVWTTGGSEAPAGGAGPTTSAGGAPFTGPVAASTPAPTVQGTFAVGGRPEAIAVSPDGRRALVASSSEGTEGGNTQGDAVRVVDTGERRRPRDRGPARPAAGHRVDPSGARAYVSVFDPARPDNGVVVLDLASSTVGGTVNAGLARPFALALTPDGARLFVTNHDGADLTVIDTATNSIAGQPGVPDTPFGIALLADGTAYLTQYAPGAVTVLDTRDNGVTASIPVGAQPFGIAASPDGRRVLAASYGADAVAVIDTASNQVVASTPVGRGPRAVAVARDGRHAYVTDTNSDTVSVLDVGTGAVTATVPVGTTPAGVALSPDGRLAYVTNQNADSVSVLAVG